MNDLELKSFSNKSITNGALKKKELPSKIKVLNWGKNETTNGDVYLNEDTLKYFQSYQKQTGRDKNVPIDFDHCTVPGSKEYVAGAPKHIAGYGDPEIIKGDGLYLNNIEWTEEGEENARNYKDLSPAAFCDKSGLVRGLDSVALTPTGAINDLTFYSSKGFDDMIKKMNISDKGGSNAKATSTGFVLNDSNEDYNKNGANAGVKKVGDNYIAVNPMDASDMGSSTLSADKDKDEDKDHDEDCICDECVESANNKIKLSSVSKEGKSNNVKTKIMNANVFPKPDAYKAEEWYNNTMNDSIIKKMSAIVGMDGETDAAKVLFAFLAKYEGLQTELSDLVNKKADADEGGLKQFSAKIGELENEIKSLKNQNTSSERDFVIAQAKKDGKIIPFSADKLKTVDLDILKEVVANTPKRVPMEAQLKTLSATPKNKPSREETAAMFNEQVASFRK